MDRLLLHFRFHQDELDNQFFEDRNRMINRRFPSNITALSIHLPLFVLLSGAEGEGRLPVPAGSPPAATP
jgi:hypothetical protein